MGTPRRSALVLDLLTESRTPEEAAAYYRDKVHLRPLYLKPTPQDDTSGAPDPRSARQKARQQKELQKRRKSGKPKPLSAKQKRALQIYKLPRQRLKYALYVPLHRLWLEYMRKLLGLDRKEDTYGRFVEPRHAGPLLTSADYHGALVEVVRGRCVGMVGLKGIVLRDTMFTFEIITAQDRRKVIPKEFNVFRMEIPVGDAAETRIPAAENGDAIIRVQSENGEAEKQAKPIVLEIHGSSFEFRAADRATRKFALHLPDV